MIIGCAAHLKRGTQVVAHEWPINLAEEPAAIVVGELHTADTRWFAVGHARDGR